MYVKVEKSKENKNRAVGNSVAQKKSNERQSLGFVDNRPEAVAQRKRQEMTSNGTQAKQAAKMQAYPIQRKKNFRLTPAHLNGTNEDSFVGKLQNRVNELSSNIRSRKNKRWESESTEDKKHTVGSMITLDGDIKEGYSKPASEALKRKHKKSEIGVNENSQCAEELILEENPNEPFVFSIARDGLQQYKPACGKCESGQVLGEHNIVDAATDGMIDRFWQKHQITNLFERKKAEDKKNEERQKKAFRKYDWGTRTHEHE